jgi:hypothetical protein
LSIERALCGGYEQSKNQSGDCRSQANPKPHHVFGVLVQMMLRQRAAEQRAEKNATQRR